jgi:hypothetical protein
MKYRIDLALGWAAFRLDLNAEAQQAYIRETMEFPGSDLNIWLMRLRTSELVNDYSDVYTTFQAYRRIAPNQQLPLSDRSVHALEHGFGTLASAQKAQLEFETYLESSAGGLPIPSSPGMQSVTTLRRILSPQATSTKPSK